MIILQIKMFRNYLVMNKDCQQKKERSTETLNLFSLIMISWRGLLFALVQQMMKSL